jgi:transcription elongation GreA/GreB family factor
MSVQTTRPAKAGRAPLLHPLPIVLLKNDVVLVEYLMSHHPQWPEINTLKEKIKTASILDGLNFPTGVARIHSNILLRDQVAKQNFSYRLNLPETGSTAFHSDSVFRPMGAALWGMQSGDELIWPTGKGNRYYFILSVVNPVESF